VRDLTGIPGESGAFELAGSERVLTYRPRLVTLDDGTEVAHESQGGQLASVWSTDLGDCYVEVIHLGDGPVGGELVMVVPAPDTIAVGDLYALEPTGSIGSWAAAVDLVLGLTTTGTTIWSSVGLVSRDELESFHQRLLGILHA